MVSVSTLFRSVFAGLKILIVFVVAGAMIWPQREQIVEMSTLDARGIAHFFADTGLWLCIKIAGVLVALALVDYGYQRWKHERDLRMTDQELREELQQSQADPQLTARRRDLQRQQVATRVEVAAPSCDVVVTNKRGQVIGFEFKPSEHTAPIVKAKGSGTPGQRIQKVARERRIPIIESTELTNSLFRNVNVGQVIPSTYYAVVAELLGGSV